MKLTQLLITSACLTCAANAALMVNFGGNGNTGANQTIGAATAAGINGSTGWTNVTADTDAVGVTDGARTVTWAANNNWGGTQAAALDGDDALMTTWLDDGGLTVTLTGLTIGDQVTIYGNSDNGNQGRSLGWAIDGADVSAAGGVFTLPLNANGDFHDGFGVGDPSHHTFTATAATHVITAHSDTGGVHRSGVAGIEVQAIPEPSSLALLGLGSLALLRRRRK